MRKIRKASLYNHAKILRLYKEAVSFLLVVIHIHIVVFDHCVYIWFHTGLVNPFTGLNNMVS